jgi:hypothetical protein
MVVRELVKLTIQQQLFSCMAESVSFFPRRRENSIQIHSKVDIMACDGFQSELGLQEMFSFS